MNGGKSMKNKTPFYFADYVWRNEKGHITYGMLLTKRPEDKGLKRLHEILQDAFIHHKKVAIKTVYDNREQALDGYVIHLSKEEDIFTFMDINGSKIVIDFYDVVDICLQD
jgi:hypothetical protein